MRATSRRTPSKPESTTALGVSSMMKSTPVRFSSARMLRPSRPMIRPFMSSEGSWTTDTVVSAAWLAARRCIATDEDRAHAALGVALGLLLDLTQPAGARRGARGPRRRAAGAPWPATALRPEMRSSADSWSRSRQRELLALGLERPCLLVELAGAPVELPGRSRARSSSRLTLSSRSAESGCAAAASCAAGAGWCPPRRSRAATRTAAAATMATTTTISIAVPSPAGSASKRGLGGRQSR